MLGVEALEDRRIIDGDALLPLAGIVADDHGLVGAGEAVGAAGERDRLRHGQVVVAAERAGEVEHRQQHDHQQDNRNGGHAAAAVPVHFDNSVCHKRFLRSLRICLPKVIKGNSDATRARAQRARLLAEIA